MIREVLADGSIDRGGAFQSIPRPRVQARLAEACAERVALIVAPAGYGKSVALDGYLATLRSPYVRYDVDETSTNLGGFVRGLVAAIETIAPVASATLADALRSVLSAAAPGAELAHWLHAHLKGFGGTIVIDDFHKSGDDPETGRFLSALVDKTKPRTRWLISTRSTLDLPVASWLAYGTSSMAVDEQDLGFTLDEARSAARSLRLAVRDEELGSILELTSGWPTAVAFSLRSSTRSTDLKNIAATTREMIYRYLAEQVYNAMPEISREFLRDAALLPRLSVRVLELMGYDRAESMLEELRHSVAFISVDLPGRYRIHDLFRDFLDYESRMLGKEHLIARLKRVARALEESERPEDALSLYRRSDDHQSIVRLIESMGFDLSMRGGNELLESAIAVLPTELRTKNATIVGLRAMFQADRQRTGEAERLFRKSYSLASDPQLKARFALALNALLSGEGKTGAISLLEDDALLNHEDVQTRMNVCGALAMSYSIANRFDEARRLIDVCLDSIDEVDDTMRARTLNRLSIACFYLADYDHVDLYANQAAALASEIGLFGLASRCFGALYSTSLMRSDNTQALWFAQQSAAAAVRGADKVMHKRALCSIIDIEAQRGNTERVESTLRTLVDLFGREALNEPFAVLEALALQAGWNGQFERSLHYLDVSLKEIFDPAQVAMRRSLLALLHASLDRRDEALEQLALVMTYLDDPSVSRDRWHEFSVVFSSIANVILGRTTVAKKSLRAHPPLGNGALPMWRLASRLADSSMRTQTADFEADLRLIVEAGYGGYALLLRALPLLEQETRGIDLLTPTEAAVFSLLDRGMRPKAIAVSTGRSVNTIQNHIRSVISKLGTSGRDEALVVARQRGLLSKKLTSHF